MPSPLFMPQPQPQQPPQPEQRPGVDVEAVVRQVAALAVMSHKATMEISMKIAELSSKVDTLISVATSIKSTADAQPAASVPEDDPEVEALARRIDDAIAVLQGAGGARNPGFDPVVGNTPGVSNPAGFNGDPNAQM